MNNNWNNDFENGYRTAVQAENEWALDRYVASVMRRVFGKMTLGLLLTALSSFLMLMSPGLLNILFSSNATIFILFAVEIGLVLYLSARISKMSNGMATAMFYLYSIVNGVALTPIFLAYTGTSIAMTFAITAGTFGVMAIAGYVTKKDLTKFGSFLMMALIGIIICMVVNIFLNNSMMSLCISIAAVIIFVGLTAWDTQAIKRMCAETDSSMVSKVATMGALTLYLDFINLFIHLLRILGSRD